MVLHSILRLVFVVVGTGSENGDIVFQASAARSSAIM